MRNRISINCFKSFESNFGMVFKLRNKIILGLLLIANILSSQNLPQNVTDKVIENLDIYRIFVEDNRMSDAGMMLSKVAVIYWNYNQYDSAIYYFEKAVDIFKSINSYNELASLYTNLGAVNLEKNDLKNSIANYKKSIDITREMGNYKKTAIKMIDLSNAYSLNNQSDKALNYVKQAMKIAKDETSHDIVLSCYNQMSDIYNKSGRQWKSKEYQLRFNHYRDSLEGYDYDLDKVIKEEKSKYIAKNGDIKVEENETAKTYPKKKQSGINNIVPKDELVASKINETIITGDSMVSVTDKSEVYKNYDSTISIEAFRKADVMPEFPGGDFGLQIFLANSLNLSPEYITKEKDSLIVEQIINKYGFPVNNRIIKGINPVIDSEVLKAILKMPSWSPGKIKNENVNVYVQTVIQYPFPDVQTVIVNNLHILQSKKEKILAGENPDTISKYYMELGNLHFYLKENEKALDYYLKAWEKLQKSNNKAAASDVLFNIANIYYSWVRYNSAIKYYLESYKLKKEIKDIKGSGRVLYHLGEIYYEMADTLKALDYFNKSLEIDNKLDNKQDKAVTLNNIGIVYFNQKKLDKALKYYKKALKIYKKIDNKFGSATTMNNIGNVEFELNNYVKAVKSYKQSIALKNDIEYYEGIALSLYNIGNVYFSMNELDNAINYYKESINISRQYSLNELEAKNYEALAEIFAKKENCFEPLKYHKLYTKLRFYTDDKENITQLSEYQVKYVYNNVLSNNFIQKINKLQQANIAKDVKISRYLEELREQKLIAKLEAEKSSQRIALLNKEKQLQKKEIVRKRTQRNALILSLILVLIILAIIYYYYKHNKLLNIILTKQKKDILEKNNQLSEQKEEIETQRDSLAKQNEKITFQNKEIIDSISYAQRIQSALLPNIELIKKRVDNAFVLYKPRNIVSGDFYWFTIIKNKVVFVESDCTGHGVPGAFMSLLGIKMLNEIIIQKNILQPAKILHELRKGVIDLLQQQGEVHEIHDGMDITIGVYDIEKNKLEISSANQRAYLFQNDRIVEYKGDKMPIGHFIRMDDFTSRVYDIKKGDTLYLFSDGYIDQFGGKDMKKLKYKDFKELLAKCSKMPFTAQKQFLEDYHKQWKGSVEQIDDILILGIRF